MNRADCRGAAITTRHRHKGLASIQARRNHGALRLPLLILIAAPFSPRLSRHRAVVGLFIGFVARLGDANRAAGIWFSTWIEMPELFWPWPVFGGLIAGLTTYTIGLWKNSN